MVGRRLSPPGRELRPIPPMRADHYPPAYPDRERMKRDFRKPSPDMHRRSRSMSPPPPKKRHPPSPGGYRGASPGMPPRRRRSFSPAAPPPPPTLRRSRSRSPQRKQRAPPSPHTRGSHRGGSVPRESRRSSDGHPGDFYGPWGTKIAVHDLKKITVDIKRNLPKGKRSSSPIIRRIINADDITLYRRNGEGARPLLERPELRAAVNRRFDDAPPPAPPQPEPRVVAIIPDPGPPPSASRDRHVERGFERRSRSRERSYQHQQVERPIPVGDRIDRDRSERTQRQVEKLEQMEVAIDRKLEQIQRYERKYEETMRDEKYGDAKDDRKMVDRSIRDRLGPKRPRDEFAGAEEVEHQPRLPDFSQRPNKPPIWEGNDMRREYYTHENRDNGFRGRPGRGVFRGRGRARGRGRMSPTSWQHDKYDGY